VADGFLQGKAGPPAGTPPAMPFAIHHHDLTQSGICQIQSANLGALAGDKVWLSCTMILPLRAQGNAGSPVRPVAIGAPAQWRRVSRLNRYCARRGIAGGVGGAAVPEYCPGSGAGAGAAPPAGGAGAGAPTDGLSSGIGGGASPGAEGAGFGNEGPCCATWIECEGAGVEADAAGSPTSATRAGCAAGAASTGCRTTWAEDDAGNVGNVPGGYGIPTTVTAKLPLSVFRMKL
jgi:hypothetical protein